MELMYVLKRIHACKDGLICDRDGQTRSAISGLLLPRALQLLAPVRFPVVRLTAYRRAALAQLVPASAFGSPTCSAVAG